MTLLTDARFENLAVLAGGMSYEDWARNDAGARRAAHGGRRRRGERPRRAARAAAPRRRSSPPSPARSRLRSPSAFLWRPGGRLARWRDALLLAFAATTFSFATVRGFGWLLMCLGIAQCEPERRTTRAAYLAVFALIALYRATPWSRALIAWLER